MWLLDNPSMYILPNKIRKIRIFSIKSVYELLTAKVWIDNCRKYFFIIYLSQMVLFIFKLGMGDWAKKSRKRS